LTASLRPKKLLLAPLTHYTGTLRYINNHCPKKLAFDHDGEHFYGIPVNNLARPKPRRQPCITPPSSSQSHGSNNNPSPSPSTALSNSKPHHNNPFTTPTLPFRPSHPRTQALNQLTAYINPSSGRRSISRLQDSAAASGTVVLATLHEDGVLEAETLARLPGQVAGDYTAVVLRGAGGAAAASGGDDAGEEGERVLFLDREDRPFRRFRLSAESGFGGDGGEIGLPLVLKRKRETIPVVVGEGGGYDVERGIGWRGDDSGREVKRRFAA
jgi:hypothetical protein